MTDNHRLVEFDFHPLADMFPLIEGDEFDELVEDIKANGLRELIVLYENKILDGRNRYNACIKARVTPRLRHFDPANEGPADAFVISTNMHRRHLNTKQKQEVVAKLLKRNPTATDKAIARMAGVDPKTVAAARKRVLADFAEFKKQWRWFGPEHQREFVKENLDTLRTLVVQSQG